MKTPSNTLYEVDARFNISWLAEPSHLTRHCQPWTVSPGHCKKLKENNL